MICCRRRSPRGWRVRSSAPAGSPYRAPRVRSTRRYTCSLSLLTGHRVIGCGLSARRHEPLGSVLASPCGGRPGVRSGRTRACGAERRARIQAGLTIIRLDRSVRLQDPGIFLIVLKNHILVISEWRYGGDELADVKALVDALTLEEKVALTAGEDMWSTAAVERLGIPKLHVTDGPNGARGDAFPGVEGTPSICIPCGSAIGATWNPETAQALGALVGREALDRGCRGLLAPTVNLHRSPLGGRNFECYSEDPLLSGALAAGFVRGVQSNGVFATVKHFVGNDAEFERSSISSVIDERALRELYLVPFETAVREGGALAIMTGYNRAQRALADPAARVPRRHPPRGVGFRGLGDDRLVRRGRDGRVARCRTGPRDAGPGESIRPCRWPMPSGRAISTSPTSTHAVRRLLGGFDRIGALDAPEPTVDPKEPTPTDVALLASCRGGGDRALCAMTAPCPSPRRRPPASPCSVRTPCRRPSWAEAQPS